MRFKSFFGQKHVIICVFSDWCKYYNKIVLDTTSSPNAIMKVSFNTGGCMDGLSWRARLAKSNINILNIDDERWYYEFMYHPRQGQTKWCKTYHKLSAAENVVVPKEDPAHWYKRPVEEEAIAAAIQSEVLSLRKELEG